MQDPNDEVNPQDVNPGGDTLSDSDLDQVSGGQNNGHGKGHGNSGKNNNPSLGDGSVRFIGGNTTTPPSGNITDGTSNTIILGE
jgi:hypothetical protein